MDDSAADEERAEAAERPSESGAAAPGRGGRMSWQRKTAAVRRLLRGEDLEPLIRFAAPSRSLGVTAATLTTGRDAFLAAGEAALVTRPASGEALESERLKVKPGERMVERDLPHEKIAILDPAALWPVGGRSDARRPVARHRPLLWPGCGLPGLARVARDRLPAAGCAAAGTSTPRWAGRADAGRGLARCDPRRAGRQPVPWRRASQGMGGAGLKVPLAKLVEWPAEGRRRVQGVRTARRRVLRLMRAHDLRAPSHVGAPRGPRSHEGTIIPAAIDTMGGTELTTTITGEGQAAVFLAIDPFSAECVGIHAARQAARFEALGSKLD